MIQFDAGELQCCRLDVGAFEGLNPEEQAVFGIQQAAVIHARNDGGNFQQGIGGTVEAAGFHIHYHWQIATEPLRHG